MLCKMGECRTYSKGGHGTLTGVRGFTAAVPGAKSKERRCGLMGKLGNYNLARWRWPRVFKEELKEARLLSPKCKVV